MKNKEKKKNTELEITEKGLTEIVGGAAPVSLIVSRAVLSAVSGWMIAHPTASILITAATTAMVAGMVVGIANKISDPAYSQSNKSTAKDTSSAIRKTSCRARICFRALSGCDRYI